MKRIFSPSVIVIAVLVLGAGLALYRGFVQGPNLASAGLVIPSFSEMALAGKVAFDANCAKCHGKNGTGTDKGPPLMHDIYNPGHHSDAAFHRAVRNGTPRHHWPFGDMPPQPQVTASQVDQIVRYIRELQAANGIHYRPHRM